MLPAERCPPNELPGGPLVIHSLVMRRKYVLWRYALVCERLRCVCVCVWSHTHTHTVEVRALEALGMGFTALL